MIHKILTVKNIIYFLIVLLAVNVAVYLFPSGIGHFQKTDKINGQMEEYLKIDLNTASKEELMSIEGVGVVTAGKIIAYRQANGKFKNINELGRIKGISKTLFERLSKEVKIN